MAKEKGEEDYDLYELLTKPEPRDLRVVDGFHGLLSSEELSEIDNDSPIEPGVMYRPSSYYDGSQRAKQIRL